MSETNENKWFESPHDSQTANDLSKIDGFGQILARKSLFMDEGDLNLTQQSYNNNGTNGINGASGGIQTNYSSAQSIGMNYINNSSNDTYSDYTSNSFSTNIDSSVSNYDNTSYIEGDTYAYFNSDNSITDNSFNAQYLTKQNINNYDTNNEFNININYPDLSGTDLLGMIKILTQGISDLEGYLTDAYDLIFDLKVETLDLNNRVTNLENAVTTTTNGSGTTTNGSDVDLVAIKNDISNLQAWQKKGMGGGAKLITSAYSDFYGNVWGTAQQISFSQGLITSLGASNAFLISSPFISVDPKLQTLWDWYQTGLTSNDTFGSGVSIDGSTLVQEYNNWGFVKGLLINITSETNGNISPLTDC